MHVLLVSRLFPRADGDAAGVSVWRLAEGLRGRGHDVTVIAPADRGDPGEPRLGAIRVRRVRYGAPAAETLAYDEAMFRRVARSPFAALAFRRLVRALAQAVDEETRQRAVTVIHAFGWAPAGLAVSRAPRHGRRFVLTFAGPDGDAGLRLPVVSGMAAGVCRSATTVTAASQPLAAAAAALLGVPRTDIAVTPLPLGLGLGADLDQPRSGAVFVGRLLRRSGVHDLLEALALLRREGDPLDLVVVGDGPERAHLKAQAIALGVHATFVGFAPPDEVAAHLRDKAVCVQPALSEGSGIAVAEALTQGVPVVATRTGTVAEYLDDPEAGILVGRSDPVALAAAIREVVRSERYRMAAWRAGRSLADRLSPERVAERFEALYTQTRTSTAVRTAAR